MFKLNMIFSDIIPIINYAWARSFNNVNTIKKTIRDRGWGPINKILLQHPIQVMQGRWYRQYSKKAQQDEQILQNIEESKEKCLNFCDSIEKVKKWSACIIFKTGKCYPDKDMLTMVINAKHGKDNNFIEKVTKLYCEYCEKKRNTKKLYKRSHV